jgi:mucin-19
LSNPAAATTTCPGGTLRNSVNAALTAGDVGIQLNGGSIPASGSCTISVEVFMATAGIYLNTLSPVTTTNAGIGAGGATASVSITPAVNLSISKTNGITTLAAGDTTAYTVTLVNLGPGDAAGATVRDIPSAGLQCTTLSCTATGSAVCPSLSVSAFLAPGAGLVIPSLPANTSLSLVLGCGVSATGQ